VLQMEASPLLRQTCEAERKRSPTNQIHRACTNQQLETTKDQESVITYYVMLLSIIAVQTETTSEISRQAVCPDCRLSRSRKMDTKIWRLGQNIYPSTPGRKNCNRQFGCDSNKAASPQAPRDQRPSQLHSLHYQQDFRGAHDEDVWAKNGVVENTRDREHPSPLVASAVACPPPYQHQVPPCRKIAEWRHRTYACHPRASTCKEQPVRFIYIITHYYMFLPVEDALSRRESNFPTQRRLRGKTIWRKIISEMFLDWRH